VNIPWPVPRKEPKKVKNVATIAPPPERWSIATAAGNKTQTHCCFVAAIKLCSLCVKISWPVLPEEREEANNAATTGW